MPNELEPNYATPLGTPVATPGLSEPARIIDTFIAPSKTFTDILRKASWWGPFILLAVMALAQAFVVSKQVGFDRVAQNQVNLSPKLQEQMSQMTPEQRQRQMSMTANISKYATFAVPAFIIIGFAIYALILWACFNFILGSTTTFGQCLAVVFYASLPYLLLYLLTIFTLYVGGNAESYDYKHPAGSNPGYYMTESAAWLRALLGRFDLFELWILGLVTYGMSIIAKKSFTQAAVVTVSLWLIMSLFVVGGAAFSS